MGAQVGGDGREEKEGQVVVASCNRSRAESHRLATGSGGSQTVRGRAKDKRPFPRHQGAPGFRRSSEVLIETRNRPPQNWCYQKCF